MEKQNATKKNIRKLIVNKKEITNQQEILKITEQYYKELYSSKQTLLDLDNEFLQQQNIPKIEELKKNLARRINYH